MSADDRVREIIAATRAVFLDFDGPVTGLFANGRSAHIAEDCRNTARALGLQPDSETATSADPLAVLGWAQTVATPDQLVSIEHACVAGEIAAARESPPTPGADEFLIACHESRRPVFILSNNSTDAIHAYLRHHDLSPLIEAVIGRTPGRPDLMKPHRAGIDQALSIAAVPPVEVLFIGDSLTDHQVAQETGLRFIGYAKNPRRGHELTEAGSTANVTSKPSSRPQYARPPSAPLATADSGSTRSSGSLRSPALRSVSSLASLAAGRSSR